MARLPRLDLPGIPQHVVQRGNNRLPCFLDAFRGQPQTPRGWGFTASGTHARSAAPPIARCLPKSFLTTIFKAIRTYLQQQRALGRDDFREMVEARTRQFAGIRPAHRPGTGTYRNK